MWIILYDQPYDAHRLEFNTQRVCTTTKMVTLLHRSHHFAKKCYTCFLFLGSVTIAGSVPTGIRKKKS